MAASHTNELLPENGRVLMIRLSALGDILFALETLSSLKTERPDVTVDFVVEDRFAPLLRGHPMIDELIVFPRRHKLQIPGYLTRLRRRRYDVLLDLHCILKSSFQVWAARARRKVGYAAPVAREGASLLYHDKVVLPRPTPHRAECGAFLLRAIGLSGKLRAPTLPDAASVPDVFGQASGVKVILHPGTSAFAVFKRWPIERFAELARELVDAKAAVAVSYGPGEIDLFEAISASVPEVLRIDGARHGLHGLAGVLRQAEVLVAADTGPLHIAAAVGTRVVALFGPKDTQRYGPRGEGHTVLFHPVPCRPCKLRTCPSPQCVLGIRVEDVAAGVLRPAATPETETA